MSNRQPSFPPLPSRSNLVALASPLDSTVRNIWQSLTASASSLPASPLDAWKTRATSWRRAKFLAPTARTWTNPRPRVCSTCPAGSRIPRWGMESPRAGMRLIRRRGELPLGTSLGDIGCEDCVEKPFGVTDSCVLSSAPDGLQLKVEAGAKTVTRMAMPLSVSLVPPLPLCAPVPGPLE